MGVPQKWVVKIMENPLQKNGWFGGKPHYFWKHPYVSKSILIGGGDFCNCICRATFFYNSWTRSVSGILGTLPITFKLFTTTSLRFVRFEETVSAFPFVFPNRLKPTQGVYLLLLSGWVQCSRCEAKNGGFKLRCWRLRGSRMWW